MKTMMLIMLSLGMNLQSAHAQVEETSPLLSTDQIELVAKGAITDELKTVNEGLSHHANHIDGYTGPQLKAFYKLGKEEISPEYLYDKCVYSEQNLVSLMSTTLTLGDDSVATHKGSLEGVKALYNSKLWRFLSRICVNSEERFVERLHTLTSQGKPVTLSETAITQITKVIFFPTDFGKPSFKKELLTVFNSLLSGAFLVGSTSSLFGLPFAGLILTVSSLINTASGIARSIPVAQAVAGKFGRIELGIHQNVGLELNETEQSIAAQTGGR